MEPLVTAASLATDEVAPVIVVIMLRNFVIST
jgi:hypothetical protein